MKKAIFKWIRGLLAIMFVIAVSVVALYPFHGRDLTLKVRTTKEVYDLSVLKEEVDSGNVIVLVEDLEENEEIEKIDAYGTFSSISLKTFMKNDVEIIEKAQVVFKEEARQNLVDLSNTFLLERLCVAEVFLIIFMLLFIITFVIEEKADPNNRNNHGPIYEVKRFLADIKKYAYYMVYAARTDLNAEVANSYLNRLWWLLEPFFTMMVYVVVFGKVMGHSVENYATFVYSALLMWTFFSKTVNYSVKLVRNNKDIVTKVYVPKFVILISNMFLNLFKLLFSLIVLVGMMIVFKVPIGFETLYAIPAYCVMMLLAFGAGMILLHYGVYVDDLSYAMDIVLRMLMFLSGIFYVLKDTLSDTLGTMMLCLNPVALLIDTMRNALVYKQITNVPLLAVWFLISLVLCCIGVHIVYKNENGYVKVV